MQGGPIGIRKRRDLKKKNFSKSLGKGNQKLRRHGNGGKLEERKESTMELQERPRI